LGAPGHSADVRRSRGGITATFIVECYWPGIARDKAADLGQIARVAGISKRRTGAQLLTCIIVPSDGLAYLLFRASDEGMVWRLSELAEVPFDRVVVAIDIGFGVRA
jgi:hypothetical protein